MKLTATQQRALETLKTGEAIECVYLNGRGTIYGAPKGTRFATLAALHAAGLVTMRHEEHKEQRPAGPFGSNRMGYRTFIYSSFTFKIK